MAAASVAEFVLSEVDAIAATGARARGGAGTAAALQMIRSVIALSTARVRSRVPSLSRMVET